MILCTQWGIGDEILLSAIAREWKKQDPNIKLYARTTKANEWFINNPNISPADGIADTELLVPAKLQLDGIHPVIDIANALGLTISDIRPEIYLTDEEKEWAKIQVAPFIGQRILAVCGHASDIHRTYPIELLTTLVDLLHKENFIIIEMGSIHGPYGWTYPYKPLSNADASFTGKTSLRQAAALLSVCDAFVGASTCFIAMSVAVGIPQVIIFRKGMEGRNNKYANTIGVEDDSGPCDPRCLSSLYSGPCFRIPPCLHCIPPEKIRDAVCSLFEKKDKI